MIQLERGTQNILMLCASGSIRSFEGVNWSVLGGEECEGAKFENFGRRVLI